MMSSHSGTHNGAPAPAAAAYPQRSPATRRESLQLCDLVPGGGSASSRVEPTIATCTPEDVLNGRGHGVQRHPGNVKYRTLVSVNKVRAASCRRMPDCHGPRRLRATPFTTDVSISCAGSLRAMS